MWHEAQENGVVWGALRWRQLQEQKGPGVKKGQREKSRGAGRELGHGCRRRRDSGSLKPRGKGGGTRSEASVWRVGLQLSGCHGGPLSPRCLPFCLPSASWQSSAP